MNYPIEYVLTDMDVRILRGLAKLKSGSFEDKAHSPKAKLWSKGNTDEEKNFRGHYLGVVGEYVFAKMKGGFFDPVPKKYGDKNLPDVIVGTAGIAVKTTPYYPPIFKIMDTDQIVKSKYIALCYFDGDRKVILTGHVSVDEFMEKHYKRDFGYGETMCYEFVEKLDWIGEAPVLEGTPDDEFGGMF